MHNLGSELREIQDCLAAFILSSLPLGIIGRLRDWVGIEYVYSISIILIESFDSFVGSERSEGLLELLLCLFAKFVVVCLIFVDLFQFFLFQLC